MRRDRGCIIKGWGAALPDRVVSNEDIAGIVDTNDKWIIERSGIRTRRAAAGPFANANQVSPLPGAIGSTGGLAVAAARRALDSANMTPQQIGMIVLCTTIPDKQLPATSAMVAGALGIHSGAMDLNASCAGFVYGLVAASSLIGTGVDNVLLIGSETMTKAVDWLDRSSAFLFGDGAGALVIGSVDEFGSLLAWDFGVDGTLADLLYADHGSGIAMRGKEVFRNAVRLSVQSSRISMSRAGIAPSDIDLFVPHQANERITASVAKSLGIRTDRIATSIEHTGNTSSASIPLALIDAIDANRLQSDDLILFTGFGAGMTWGSAIWRWEGN